MPVPNPQRAQSCVLLQNNKVPSLIVARITKENIRKEQGRSGRGHTRWLCQCSGENQAHPTDHLGFSLLIARTTCTCVYCRHAHDCIPWLQPTDSA